MTEPEFPGTEKIVGIEKKGLTSEPRGPIIGKTIKVAARKAVATRGLKTKRAFSHDSWRDLAEENLEQLGSHMRDKKDAVVYTIQKPPKTRKCEKQVLSFSDGDYAGVSLPHTDALVVTLAIANYMMHPILVDIESSTNILCKSTFDLMKIDRGKLVLARCPLVGFVGEQ
jgi:hypothetical protein